MSATGIPGFTYSNECTISVDRRFYYFADVATKTVGAGQEVILDLSPSWTGDDVPSYQWQFRQVSTNGPWTNISGETSSSYTILASNVTSALNNFEYRCLVTLNEVTTFQYNRNNTTVVQNISPAGTQTATQVIKLNVIASAILGSQYTEERQKVGAAIGTVICVPKPSDYVHDASANTDDAERWKVALTGQTLSGSPAAGVNSTTRPYGPNDRFPGFIEMRGQILKAQEYPELARMLGTTYGGNISGTYPNYNANDTFRLPSLYGKKLMGTGNVDNNRSSPSIVPEYNPNSTPGGNIFTAGSMGGVYNFEKIPQLPPGSPGDGSGADGISTDTFTIGTHRTDGWDLCTGTVDTTFRGQFTWQVSDSSGIGTATIGLPVHTHRFNSIRATSSNNVSAGSSSTPTNNATDGGQVLNGPAFLPVTPGRSHQHVLSLEDVGIIFNPPTSGGGGGGVAGDLNFTSTSQFTLPLNVNGFEYNIKGGAGGGGGTDSRNQGGRGGDPVEAIGRVTDIPGGSVIGVKIGLGGGGGQSSRTSAAGGSGGNTGGTGFGGGAGGSAGGRGTSGGGGGGGGASFIHIISLGSGSNPKGLQVGDLLVVVGGSGGGGGAGWYNGSLVNPFPGGDGSTSWSSSNLTSAVSSTVYSNKSTLSFLGWDGTRAWNGKTGTNKGATADGGGGGGGGGGFTTGGLGGTLNTGDAHGNGGGAGRSAYRSDVHVGTPTLSATSGGGGVGSSGTSGSASISYSGATTTPPTNPGGTNSPDHGEGLGTTRGFPSVSETVTLHTDPTSTSPSMGIEIIDGNAVMSTRSRTPWDSALSFYLRNNEVCPMIQPYFRLKYMIKAF